MKGAWKNKSWWNTHPITIYKTQENMQNLIIHNIYSYFFRFFYLYNASLLFLGKCNGSNGIFLLRWIIKHHGGEIKHCIDILLPLDVKKKWEDTHKKKFFLVVLFFFFLSFNSLKWILTIFSFSTHFLAKTAGFLLFLLSGQGVLPSLHP